MSQHLGLNITCPFKLHSPCLRKSSSHVTSSIGKFFHLMRYSPISLFCNCLIHVSMFVSGSSMIFLSSSIFGKYSKLGYYQWWPSLKMKYGRPDVQMNMDATPIFNPYYQSSTIAYRDHSSFIQIYCPYFFARGHIFVLL